MHFPSGQYRQGTKPALGCKNWLAKGSIKDPESAATYMFFTRGTSASFGVAISVIIVPIKIALAHTLAIGVLVATLL